MRRRPLKAGRGVRVRTADGRLILKDIIIGVAGLPVTDVNDLYRALDGRK